MKRTALTSVTTAAGLIFSLGFLSAMPAAAATAQTINVNCNSPAGNPSPTIFVGDTLVITQTGCGSFIGGGPAGQFGYGAAGSYTSGTSGNLTSGDEVVFLATTTSFSFAPTGVSLYVSNDGGGAPSVEMIITVLAAPVLSDEPPSLIQQFGKPASGTCNAAASTSLNWSNVASGGWSESWAQWVNNGNGGAVCTRTLVYSTAQSRWIVG
jgi:hypothetical protein